MFGVRFSISELDLVESSWRLLLLLVPRIGSVLIGVDSVLLVDNEDEDEFEEEDDECCCCCCISCIRMCFRNEDG